MKKLSALGGRINYIPANFFAICMGLVLFFAASLILANPASAQNCGPFSISVAHGGSVQLNAGSCDPFGLNNPSVTTPPAHGTVTVLNIDSGLVEYSHNGGADIATTDSFVLAGASNQVIQVNVTIGAAAAITISPGALGSMRAGVGFNQSLSASGGIAPYTFAIISGSFPGLTFTSAGVLSGTPSERGPHTIVVEVTDNTGATAQKSYGVTVDNPIMTTSPLAITLGTGEASTRSFTTTGGVAPYTYIVNGGSGPLPPGITLASNGNLVGTPTAAGTYPIQIVAQESSTSSICNCPYFKVDNATITVTAAPTITVQPVTIPGAGVGVAYSQTITASGGTAPYFFQPTAPLPAGLTLNNDTGVISGTPTAGGNFSFGIIAIDANSFDGNRSYSIRVANVVVAPATVPGGAIGAAYNQTLTSTGGTAPYTYTVSAGTLPTGFTLSGAGALSGTPTAAGTFNFTVRSTDDGNFSGTRAYTLTVAAPTTAIAPPTLPSAQAGAAYSQTIIASGGLAPYTYAITAGALPSGLTLSAGGVLSGTPSVSSGIFNFTVTATGSSTGTGAPHTGSRAYALVVNAAPLVLPATTLAAGSTGTAYSATINPATGGVAPYTYALSAGSLPAGVALSAAGGLSGTPTEAGAFGFTVTATDSASVTATQTYALTIGAPTLALSPPSGTIVLTYGQAASQNFTASGGVTPYSYAATAGALPPGMSFNAAGVLSGTPTTPGLYTVSLRATDSSTGTGAPFSTTNNYVIQVAAPTITITPAALPIAQVAAAYSANLAANGGVGPYTFALTSGALPVGMSFNSAGQFSGTPSSSGLFSLTTTATDANGQIGTQAITLNVFAPTLSITPASLPAGTVAVAYSQALAGGDGIAPYTLSIVGALPAGLTFNPATGVISGTPTTEGNTNITVNVTDSSAGDGPQTTGFPYTIVINGPTITLPATPLSNGTVATAYTATLNGASGGTVPYTYAVTGGTLPAGLTLAANGAISGTPTTQVNSTFTVTATDNSPAPGPYTASQNYSLTIDAPTLTLPPTTLANGTVATVYTANLTGASGGTAPYTYAVTGGALPAGLSLAANGAISGTPTTEVNANFVVTATDTSPAPGPYTVDRAYTLVIGAPTLTLPDTTLAGGTVGAAYSASLNPASGGTAPYSYAVTAGALPAGLALSATGTITGTPTTIGNANFTVTVTDASPNPGPYTASRPFVLAVVDAIPVANPVTAAVGYESGPNPITLNITGGTATSVAISSAPASGTAVASGTTITYQPAVGFTGNVAFDYTATNASGTSAPAAITVTVSAAPPVAQPQAVSVPYNQAKSFVLTATGAGPLTFALQTAPTNGTMVVGADGNSTYTPNTGFSGSDSATYSVTSPGGTDTANLTFTVAGPAIVADLTGLSPSAGSLQPGFSSTVLSYKLKLPNTQESVSLTPTSRDPAARITVQGGTVSSGSSSSAVSLPVGVTRIVVVVTAQDGSTSKSYEILAERLPAAPVAVSRSVEVIAGQSARVDLTEGSTGGPFSAARIVSVSDPQAGRVTIERDGNRFDMVYASEAAFGGSLQTQYTLANAYGTSSPATITFVVISRPDPSKDPEVMGLLTAQADSAKRFATNQIQNFNSRLEQLHDEGDRRSNSMAVRLGFTEEDGPDEMDEPFDSVIRKDANLKHMEEASNGTPDFAVHSFAEEERKNKKADQPAPEVNLGRLAVWTGGFVNFGKRDDDRLSLDYTTVGVSAGMDYRFSKQFVAGFGFGYGRDATDIGENGTESRANAYSAAVYGSYSPVKSVFIDGLIGGSWLDFNSERYITSTGDFASGDRDGTQIFGSLTASYEHRTDAWLVSPYGRFDFSRSWLDGFTERGGNGLALQYGEQTVDTLSGILGLRLEYTMPMDWGVLKPGLRAEYTHDFEGSSRIKLGYADFGGLPYDFETESSGDDYVTFGASLDAALNSDWSANFDYRTAVGADDQNHSFGLRVGKRF